MAKRPDDRVRSLVYTTIRYLSGHFLEAGISARELGELVRGAYVDELSQPKNARAPGRSMSEVARLTSLSRPAVKRLRGKYARLETMSSVMTQTLDSVVMAQWYTVTDYLDEDGLPVPLPIDGEPRSIKAIVDAIELPEVKEGWPDEPLEELVNRLVRSGNIKLVAGGVYQPLQRNVSSREKANRVAVALDTSVVRAAKCVAHNLHEPESSWIQRTVTSDGVLEEDSLRRLRQSIRRKAIAFCEEIDDLMAAAVSPDSKGFEQPDGDVKKAGIGIFYFEDDYPGSPGDRG